jgi:hypothetical protein
VRNTDFDSVASSEQRIRPNPSLLNKTQEMTSSSHGSTTTTTATANVETSNTTITEGLLPEELDYESLPTTSLRVQLLAGAIAGIAEHTIVYPIDAIKV